MTEKTERIIDKEAGTHRCGSRDQNPMADRASPGDDEWVKCTNGDRTCSYCGSLHPDDFKRILEKAADPSDDTFAERATGKNYKIYVNQPGISDAFAGGIKFYTWHLPASNIELSLLYNDASELLSEKLHKRMSKLFPEKQESD